MITLAEEIVALLWVIAFMVLPALPAAWALGRLLEADWIEALASAFAVSVASVGLASIIAYATGRGLLGVAGMHVIIMLVLGGGLILAAYRASAARLAVDGWASIGIALIGLVAALERPWLLPNVDAWYHLAAARSLLHTGGALVTDPFYGLGSPVPDPTSGALHVLMAATSRFSGQDILGLWGGLNILGAMLLPAALWSLLRQLGVERRYAIMTMLAVTFFASTAELRFSAYPNQIGLGFLLLALAGFAAAVRGARYAWVLALVAGLGASATHMGVATAVMALAVIAYVGLIVFAFVSRGRGRGTSVSWPERGVTLAALGMAAGSAVAMYPRLWYLFRTNVTGSLADDSGATGAVQSVYQLFGKRLMFHPQGAFSGGDLALLLGTTMAVICLREGARRSDRLLGLAGIIGFAPIVVGFNPILTPALLGFSAYAAYRLLALTWFAPWVAVAAGWRYNPLVARLAIVGALLTALPALHNMFTEEPPVSLRSGVQNVSVAKGWERDFTQIAGRESIDDLRVAFGDSWPRVVTDEMTGYALAGMLDVHVHAVPQLHSPSAFERRWDGGARRTALKALMAPNTSVERRREIVRQAAAQYVLLWPNRVSENARISMISDTEMFDVAYNRDGIVLLKVRGQ